jgi:hypothetical protein
MHKTILIAAIAAAGCCFPAFARDMPDHTITPGDTLRTVQDKKMADCISEKTGRTVENGDPITLQMICAPGYTQCVRKVTADTKSQVYASYGLPGGNHTGYCNSSQGCEVDHLISLELGGSNDEKNLWPEPYEGEEFNAHVKDRLENFLHAQVCTGQISLTTAQHEIATNWKESFARRIAPLDGLPSAPAAVMMPTSTQR